MIYSADFLMRSTIFHLLSFVTLLRVAHHSISIRREPKDLVDVEENRIVAERTHGLTRTHDAPASKWRVPGAETPVVELTFTRTDAQSSDYLQGEDSPRQDRNERKRRDYPLVRQDAKQPL